MNMIFSGIKVYMIEDCYDYINNLFLIKFIKCFCAYCFNGTIGLYARGVAEGVLVV